MKKYFYYEIFERNGNYEYTHKGVTSFVPEECELSPEEWIEDRAKTFYSEGEKEIVGNNVFYWHFGELVTRNDGIKEITKEEYEVLRKFL